MQRMDEGNMGPWAKSMRISRQLGGKAGCECRPEIAVCSEWSGTSRRRRRDGREGNVSVSATFAEWQSLLDDRKNEEAVLARIVRMDGGVRRAAIGVRAQKNGQWYVGGFCDDGNWNWAWPRMEDGDERERRRRDCCCRRGKRLKKRRMKGQRRAAEGSSPSSSGSKTD
jgi:hypothetical protein